MDIETLFMIIITSGIILASVYRYFSVNAEEYKREQHKGWVADLVMRRIEDEKQQTRKKQIAYAKHDLEDVTSYEEYLEFLEMDGYILDDEQKKLLDEWRKEE